MKVIIPVAGEGTRLRPHTYTTPKALVPVGGKPMLAHVLEQLSGLEFSEVIFIIGWHGDQIREWVGDNCKFKCSFVEQSGRFGLGFAIQLGLQACGDEPALVVLGDTIADLDWSGLVKSQRNTLAVSEVDNPQSFGVVEVEGDRIVRLVEKPKNPPSNLAIVGVYYIKEAARFLKCLDELVERGITSHGEIQLTDAFALFLESGGEVFTYPVQGWYDCGNKETLLATNRHLLDKYGEKVKREGAVIIPPVLIAPTARIEAAVIGPHVSLGPETIVRNAVISDSIICRGARIESAVLRASVVGRQAVVIGRAAPVNIGDAATIGDE
ncbi:MAG: sugar phosphate nucleotidyltransferase [bacterium]